MFGRGFFGRYLFGRGNVDEERDAYFLPEISTPVIEKYPLRLYDGNLVKVAEIDNYSYLKWTRRLREVGEWEAKVNFSAIDPALIMAAEYVSIYRGGSARIGIIESVQVNSTEKEWSLKGPDGKGILRRRIACKNVATGTGYDTQTSVAIETAIRYFINENMISAKNTTGGSAASRNISVISLETDGARGGTVTYSARLESIADLVETLLKESSTGLGMEIVFDQPNTLLKVHFFVGTDKSGSVQFNTNFGNVSNFDYESNTTMKRNAIIVGGEGVENTRTFREVNDGSPSGITRFEAFLDARNCATTAELDAAGAAALTESKEEETAEFTIKQDMSFKYQTRDAAGDFDLGDIIKAVFPEVVSVSGRIVEVTEEYAPKTFPVVNIVLGTAKSDVLKILKLSMKQTSVMRRV